jgi:formate hydrogenlyase transcriptional activator
MVEENPSNQKHASDNNSQCNSTKPEVPDEVQATSEAQLHESENMLRRSQAIAHIGSWSVKMEEGILLCSDEAYRIFGLPVGSTCTFEMFNEIIHPDDKEYVKSSWMTALNNGQLDITYRILVDGKIMWVAVKAETMFHKENETISALGTVQDITERKEAEEEIKKYIEFQKLVTGISTKFVGLSGVEFEQSIQDTLAEIGRYFNSDTVRLYRLSLQGDVVKIRNQWRDEHIAPPEEMAEIHTMKYPNLAAHYSKGQATVFSKFDDSPQWPEMHKILKFFGTKAGVGVPLEVDSSGVDIFAMDKVQSEYIWPKDIVEQSKAIGKVILSAMRRREAEVELQDSYDEIKRLKDRLEQENVYLQQEVKLEHQHGEIIGSSTAIGKVLNKAEQVAKTDSTVLILGETGTGKELLARAIHNMSDRKARPMIKVNCAALPSTLIESELFGREKGAYTGAMTKQMGRFEVADGSTIFLDEISELSLDLQAKLLRVLQEGQFERLGDPKTIEVDVRVIAATNRDIAEASQKGTFRDDLFYRLNVFPITIPPLRERRGDIPTLVWHFVPEFADRMGKRIESIPKKTMEALQSYYWPGNVRELRNVIENAMIITTGTSLQVEIPKLSASVNADNVSLQEVERNHILAVLEITGWRIRGKNGAAEILELKPTTLEARMRKLDIHRK